MADTFDVAALREAYLGFFAAAGREDFGAPAPGEWDAAQILAHVSLITATTVAAVSTVAAGSVPAYDNRDAQDAWTLARAAANAGGPAGLRERVRVQSEALCALSAGSLGEAELATPIPTLLLSDGQVLLEGPVPLRDLLQGLADVEIPTHAEQLRALASQR